MSTTEFFKCFQGLRKPLVLGQQLFSVIHRRFQLFFGDRNLEKSRERVNGLGLGVTADNPAAAFIAI